MPTHVTEHDLDTLKAELLQSNHELSDDFRSELRKTGQELRNEIKQSNKELRLEIKQSNQELRHEIKQSNHDLRQVISQSNKELRNEIKNSVDEVLGVLQIFMQQVDERFNTLETEQVKIRADIARVFDYLDSVIKRQEINDDERLVMGHQLDRLDKWTHELATKIGHTLAA